MPHHALIIVTPDAAARDIFNTFLDGETWRRYAALLPQLPSTATACTADELVSTLRRLADGGSRDFNLLPVGLEVDINTIPGLQQDGLTVTVSAPLGLDAALADLCLRGLETARPETYADYTERVAAPAEIERQSLNFIDGLLDGQPFDATQRAVAARVIHAAGDPLLAASIEFHLDAVAAALAALRRGARVYTDVKMLAAGINRRITERFGCEVVCALDTPGVTKRAAADGVTRSRAAFESLGGALDGALVAVGNAPTALLAVLDLARDGVAAPACVIGMPVGFVQARESKERLRRAEIPFITLRGFRGGSGLTAAAVNALGALAVADD